MLDIASETRSHVSYARAGATIHDTYCTIRMPGAFWSVDLDIYFTISMSHDLRVSSLAALARCNNIPSTSYCIA